ncbi:MAG: hypothetical protein HQL32_09535 [Planctomycetes bacterium]|nr:hypothetical protein [Planctomycetota bacterium]
MPLIFNKIKNMFFKGFLLQKLRKLKSKLRIDYGVSRYYTKGQVLTACKKMKFSERVRNYSIVLFCKKEDSQGILAELTSKETQRVIVKNLIIWYGDNLMPDYIGGDTFELFQQLEFVHESTISNSFSGFSNSEGSGFIGSDTSEAGD